MSEWSNLAKIVYRRTYARNDNGKLEKWEDTVRRVIEGNVGRYRGTDKLEPNEEERLNYYLLNRKAGPGGRGWWFSGSPNHARLGGTALNNCFNIAADTWASFADAQDLLMLGGGVGMNVEHRYVSKLPKVRKDVSIVYKNTKDADFIVPDSREGWVELTRRVLESYFVTGKSFSYSTICVRGYGEPIVGFGGTASGPMYLTAFVDSLQALLNAIAGKHIRPIDAADILCIIAELVVSGNVRRSACIVVGDAFDQEYLRAKRFDLGPVPSYRSNANFSVVCNDIEDLHPSFWKTYAQGEPFGLVNRKTMQTYGRMGEKKSDSAVGVNPCAEATLESYESCNLQEIALPHLDGQAEFNEAARLMHRWGKRVTCERYHIPQSQEVVSRNRRIGTGITGCLQSELFSAAALDEAYAVIQRENYSYAKVLGIPESIRTSVVKPSGTLSKCFDMSGYEGIHPAFSRYMIQRVRFGSNDLLIPLLERAGHHIEPEIRFDGTKNQKTLVVDFYQKAQDGAPVADEDWSTWRQLDTLVHAQKHWADQAVSVTVYYKREDIGRIKEWLTDNFKYLKTISFLCHSDHGFVQAPKEAIDAATYERLSQTIKPIDEDSIGEGELESQECSSGACPIK